MDNRQRIDDAYKRKLKRNKVKSVENRFHFFSAGKSRKCKLNPLKIILAIIILVSIVTFLLSPTICHKNSISHTVSRPRFVNRWMWGGSDPRYISNLEMNWDEILRVLKKLPENNKIGGVGLLNFNENEINRWEQFFPTANHSILHLDYAEKNVTWETLYPEWIDEEQEEEIPSCPSLPKLEVPRQRLDLIAVKLPCRNEGNWSRDIARLHLQISAATLAASCKGNYPVHLLFVTKCFPIPNLFTCKDLVAHEGNTWLYKPNMNSLREKLQLPIGSCELALPLGVKGKYNAVFSSHCSSFLKPSNLQKLHGCGPVLRLLPTIIKNAN